MQIQELLNQGAKIEYSVILPLEKVTKAIDDNVEKFAKEAKIQGFRPGKVPLNIIKERYKSSILRNVLEDLVQETSAKLIKDKSLRPAVEPSIDIIKFAEDSEMEYKISLELMPNIEIPDFSQISLEKFVLDVGEKDIEETLQKLSKDLGKYVETNKTKSEKGDILKIDFKGKVDGVFFEGGEGQNYNLELGSNSFIEGFEDQLIGEEVGSSKIVTVKFPEDYHVKNLASKEAEFEVNVKAILEAEKIDFNEDYANKLGFESLDLLKEKIKEKMIREASLASYNKIKKDLFDELMKICDFEVPQSMVTREFKDLFSKAIEDNNKNPGSALSEGDKQLEEVYKKISHRRVLLGILMSEIALKQDLRVKPDDIKKEIFQKALGFPGQEHMIFDFYRKNPKALESLKGPIIENKSVDYILSQAQVKENLLHSAEFWKAVKIEESGF